MDDVFFRVIGGVILFCLTFLQFTAFKAAQKVKDELAAYKTHVAENYIHEKIFNPRLDNLDSKLDKIFNIIEGKADKKG